MSRNTSRRVAPIEEEASISVGEMLRSALLIGSTMKGTKTCTSARITSPWVNSSRSGISMRPRPSSVWFKGPFSAAAIIQPKLRTSTPVISGEAMQA